VFGIITIDSSDSADLIVFPGGLDVDPNLYGEPAGQRTSFNPETDANWNALYKKYLRQDKKMLGICKGAQFINVVSGCPLVQHVNNHALLETHQITIKDTVYDVTSTHHQMMYPFLLDADSYDMLATSTEKRSDTYLNGYDDEFPPLEAEPEAIFFRGNGTLAIQFHPEFMDYKASVNIVIGEWFEMLFSYEPKEFFDRYNKKKSFKEFKESSTPFSNLGGIPDEVFNAFIEKHLL